MAFVLDVSSLFEVVSIAAVTHENLVVVIIFKSTHSGLCVGSPINFHPPPKSVGIDLNLCDDQSGPQTQKKKSLSLRLWSSPDPQSAPVIRSDQLLWELDQ